MATERPVISATPGGRIRSQAEIDSDGVRLNTKEPGEMLPPLEETVTNPNPDDPRDARFAGIQMSLEEVEGRKRIEEFFALPEEQRKARIATVLDRGVVHERLKVDLPADLHGEWPRNDPMEIARMRTLGFWIDDTYATRRALHSDGTSANIVGDVIHMVTTKHNKQMIDKVRLEQQLRSARNPKQAIEETDETFEKKPDSVIPTFSESNQRPVNISDVRAALAKADGQTRVQR